MPCKAKSDYLYLYGGTRHQQHPFPSLPSTRSGRLHHTTGEASNLHSGRTYCSTHQATEFSREEKGEPREGEQAIRRTCTFPLFEPHKYCPRTDIACVRERAESSFKGDLSCGKAMTKKHINSRMIAYPRQRFHRNELYSNPSNRGERHARQQPKVQQAIKAYTTTGRIYLIFSRSTALFRCSHCMLPKSNRDKQPKPITGARSPMRASGRGSTSVYSHPRSATKITQ